MRIESRQAGITRRHRHDAHRLCERSEVSVECAVVVANDNGFARLVSRNDQADLKLLEQLRQIRGMDAAKIGRFF